MRNHAALLCLACGCVTPAEPTSTSTPTPRSPTIAPMPREQAVLQMLALARLDRLELDPIAAILGTHLVTTEHQSPYRIEHHLAPTAVFATIDVIVGNDDWRVVTVTPVPELDLALQDVHPHVLDVRHSTEMQPVHSRDGFGIGAVLHHFAIGNRALVVSVAVEPRGASFGQVAEGAVRDGIDQAAAPHRRDRVGSLLVTTKSRIPPNAPTLRDFQRWAKEHP